MRRVLWIVSLACLIAPVALSACSWAWTPGSMAGCSTSETWDCPGCSKGAALTTVYACQVQTPLCCECKLEIWNCAGGSSCDGYIYKRTRRELTNYQCANNPPGGTGTYCGVAPGGGGGGG